MSSPSPGAAAGDQSLADSSLPQSLSSLAAADEPSRPAAVSPALMLTVLAFIGFLAAYALWGQKAAGIAFWSVLFGLPTVLFVVSLVGAAWRRSRREELLNVAVLAVRLEREQHEQASSADAAQARAFELTELDGRDLDGDGFAEPPGG